MKPGVAFQRSVQVTTSGERWRKTEVMWACEWKMSDWLKASTLHATGPFDTMKKTWKRSALSRYLHKYNSPIKFAQ